jgi:hypothetical protein
MERQIEDQKSQEQKAPERKYINCRANERPQR